MSSPKHMLTERQFQLMLVILGAILGFGASHWLQIQEESSRKEVLLRLIRSSIRNDLFYTIGVTDGLRDDMLKKDFLIDTTLFREIYHPSVVLPDSTDIGLLDPNVVNALDEYRRHLIECEASRQEHILALEDPNHKDLEITLLTYLIGLDSVVLSGNNLIKEIDSHYPEFMHGTDNQIPSYTPIQSFIADLQKVMNAAMAERLKKP